MKLFDKSPVLELTPSDFTGKLIKNNSFKNKFGLIMFYSPNCGYCHSAAPALKTTSAINRKSTQFAAVNAEEYPSLNNTFKIKSYPQLRIL